MENVYSVFEKAKNELLDETEEFYRILSHFRYEGKFSRTKNLKAMRVAVRKLFTVLKRHCILHESTVLPFLEVHYPRYESAITHLQLEHKDIYEYWKKLNLCLKKLSKVSIPVEDGIVYQTGICLTALLRHHIGFEDKFISKSLNSELKPGELRGIGKRANRWLRRDLWKR